MAAALFNALAGTTVFQPPFKVTVAGDVTVTFNAVGRAFTVNTDGDVVLDAALATSGAILITETAAATGSSGLTDAQLRATALAVTGPLTNAQLIAATVQVRDKAVSITTVAKVTSAAASAVCVAANAARNYAKVFNDGATVKRFAVNVAASATVGIPVAPGTGYEWPIAPAGAINVFCTAAESYQYEGD
ncbi:hypothetical protein [Phenylobacterium sp.]|uniref:hypothetical protein n=1 Tax=Phenylobacterium sp. TaxID=1871053 RepID=UPI002737F777|nr:hypothetical protein [Phenylobacterium sp.]MDP3869922.1 hypothetical protein [Phenylobacterium sp.]